VVVTRKKRGEIWGRNHGGAGGRNLGRNHAGEEKKTTFKKTLNLLNLNRPPPPSHVFPHLLY